MRHLTRKHAVSLVAVVLGGGLLGFLIPAVSTVRHTAARTRCINNFKSISLGAANYADTTGVFPPATLPNPDLPPDRRLSWFVAIVPFIESTDLYARTDKTGAWDSPKNREVLGIYYPYVRCEMIPRDDPRPIATCAGVTGVGADSPTLAVDHPRAGVLAYDRKTPRAALTDGESNTLLVMEYGGGPVPWAKGGEGTVTWFRDPPHHGPGRPFGQPHPAQRPLFGATVYCGVVGFADGSVRTFRDTVSPGVLEGLATIAGSEAVVIPE